MFLDKTSAETDSFHCCGSSSLFLIELMNLWISEHDVLPPAWSISDGILLVFGNLYLFVF
jgi:hypothetical protein